MIKKLSFATAVSALLILSGCGGGDSDSKIPTDTTQPTTQQNQEKLKLTIGNLTVDSDSSISRISTMIPQNQTLVEMYQFNKEVHIEIKGRDAEKFHFHNNPSVKRYDLFLYNAQTEGEFEIDIHASADDQTIIYKVKYIVQESTSKKLLVGKTLYLMTADDARKDTYRRYTFDDGTVTIKELELKTDEMNSEDTVEISYFNDYIISSIFKINNNYQQCAIRHHTSQYSLYYNSMQFDCLNESNRVYEKGYLMRFNKEDVIKHPHLYMSDIRVAATSITNHANINAPQIQSFVFEGNYAKEDNQTATISNRINHDIIIRVELDRALSADQKIYIFFHNNNASNVSRTGNNLELSGTEKSIFLEGDLIDSQLNKFNFTLDNQEEVMIDNSDKFETFPANGYLNLFVCESSVSLDTCHYSSIPVKFKE